MHMPRAYAVFDSQQINVTAAPTDYRFADNDNPSILNWIPQAHALSALQQVLKEYLGYLYYYFRGYL